MSSSSEGSSNGEELISMTILSPHATTPVAARTIKVKTKFRRLYLLILAIVAIHVNRMSLIDMKLKHNQHHGST